MADSGRRQKTDQQIVQEYADHGRLSELPPGVYVVPEPIAWPDALASGDCGQHGGSND